MSDPLDIDLVSIHRGAPRPYAVAGARLVSDFEYPALSAFAAGGAMAWPAEWPAPEAGGGEQVFDGMGLIGDGLRRVVCQVSAAGCWLAVEGLATYWISPDGRRVVEVEVDAAAGNDSRAVAALGAPLILALARRGTFCIHASVVMCGRHLVAFIGESGAGKSTLAHYLDQSGGPGWRRVIDDTLPLAPPGGEQVLALPHFPQLKLPDEMQPPRIVADRVRLSAVYILEEAGDVTNAPVTRSEAALALAAHTVGVRLFGRALLAEHLAVCGELAGRLPVRRLSYPRVMAALPAVGETLARDLGAIPL